MEDYNDYPDLSPEEALKLLAKLNKKLKDLESQYNSILNYYTPLISDKIGLAYTPSAKPTGLAEIIQILSDSQVAVVKLTDTQQEDKVEEVFAGLSSTILTKFVAFDKSSTFPLKRGEAMKELQKENDSLKTKLKYRKIVADEQTLLLAQMVDKYKELEEAYSGYRMQSESQEEEMENLKKNLDVAQKTVVQTQLRSRRSPTRNSNRLRYLLRQIPSPREWSPVTTSRSSSPSTFRN